MTTELSLAEERVYTAIKRTPTINPTELAEELGYTKQWIYTCLKALTLKGYLKDYVKEPSQFIILK
jgi:DNA-binding MarR family transcriptional regulator